MKLYIILLILGITAETSYSQVVPVIPGILENKPKQNGRYKRNVWKYQYEIYLKNGEIVKANSEILKDSISGKYYIYYSDEKALTKIFPEETTLIKKRNPYNMFETIEGVPHGNLWRFTVLKGRINAFCFFVNGRQINEIQLKDQEIKPLDVGYLRFLFTGLGEAMEACDKQDYYTAITIYNQTRAKKLRLTENQLLLN